jgi:hypothetical protein
MAFPPEFSSTLSYANRYDLDEIDVFLEGDSTNPMYFNIEGLNRTFGFGKHYFTISILDSVNQPYQLRGGSRVLFEFKSINNVVLKSDVAKVNEKNGLITCFFEVLKDPLRTYKEIQDGQGTFIIAASLQSKPTQQENFQIIPLQFKNAINYRCVYPINIRKNAINADSPIITNTTHKSKTNTGQFSFGNNVLPSTTKDPISGSTYNPTTGFKTTISQNTEGSL